MPISFPSTQAAQFHFWEERLAKLRYVTPMLPSEWCERHRVLPAGAGARQGRWRNFPFQVEPLNAIADPECSSLTLDLASQVLGKTSVVEGDLGWMMDQAPCATVAVFPTANNAVAWCKNRLGPMIEACEVLRTRVDKNPARKGSRSGYGTNTITHKRFPAGWFLAGGANSPANLRAHTAKLTVFEEVDGYPESAGEEGDVIILTEQRSITFPDAFSIKSGTPTIKYASRIEKEFELTDQRKWFVRCPKCDHEFVIMWNDIRWPKEVDPDTGKKIHRIDKAFMECPECKAHLTDADRRKIVTKGRWIATKPNIVGSRGYWANAFITLLKCKRGFKSWFHYWAHRFITATKLGSLGIRTFTNLILAESFEIESEKPPEHTELYRRREKYQEIGGEIILPERALFLTVGADVQADRIEAEIVAWGLDEESWSIEYKVFRGSTETPTLFNQFDQWVQKKWRHPSGHRLNPACVCIDSGNKPAQIYSYVSRCSPRLVFAIKGNRGYEATWVLRSGGRNQRLFILKVDTAKEALYSRLRLVDHGPGFCHFASNQSVGNDSTYFQQLTAESMRSTYQSGRLIRYFVLTSGERNEALDARIYAMAAKEIANPDYEAIVDSLGKTPLNDWRAEKIAERAAADLAAAAADAADPQVRVPKEWIPTRHPMRSKGWAKP